MEVIGFLLIIIFLIISIHEIIEFVDKNDDEVFKLIFFIVISGLCGVSILYEATKLRDRDVLNGNAEYIETIHISKGDTIKTYHIQSKNK